MWIIGFYDIFLKNLILYLWNFACEYLPLLHNDDWKGKKEEKYSNWKGKIKIFWHSNRLQIHSVKIGKFFFSFKSEINIFLHLFKELQIDNET